MIKLFVQEKNVSDSVISLTWCVSMELLDHLAKKNVKDPQLVICVSNTGEKYHPLKENSPIKRYDDIYRASF